jgi:alpha-galactosidase
MTNPPHAQSACGRFLAAPLLAGNDLRTMPSATPEILTNPAVIAVAQDPLGKQGQRVAKSEDQEVWARPLSAGAGAIGLFNRGGDAARVVFHAADIGPTRITKIRDLWARADRKVATEYAAKRSFPRRGYAQGRRTIVAPVGSRRGA